MVPWIALPIMFSPSLVLLAVSAVAHYRSKRRDREITSGLVDRAVQLCLLEHGYQLTFIDRRGV